jgi:two-component system, sensor histidine kinase PdtaS
VGRVGGNIQVSISDEGEGLPADFDPGAAPGLGMRIVRALSRQLNATVDIHRLARGTEMLLSLPESKGH